MLATLEALGSAAALTELCSFQATIPYPSRTRPKTRNFHCDEVTDRLGISRIFRISRILRKRNVNTELLLGEKADSCLEMVRQSLTYPNRSDVSLQRMLSKLN